MALDIINNDLRVNGDFSATTMTLAASSVTNATVSSSAAIARTKLAQNSASRYTIPLSEMRVWNAFATPLTDTANADDLGLVDGTFGTGVPTIQAGDVGNAASTRYCRFTWALPPEYVDGETVTVRLRGAVCTTVCNNSCTVDVECYTSDRDGSSTGDICTTAATTINAVADTYVNCDFTLEPATLVNGMLLDFRLAIIYDDDGDAGVMIPEIAQVEMLIDIQG